MVVLFMAIHYAILKCARIPLLGKSVPIGDAANALLGGMADAVCDDFENQLILSSRFSTDLLTVGALRPRSTPRGRREALSARPTGRRTGRDNRCRTKS